MGWTCRSCIFLDGIHTKIRKKRKWICTKNPHFRLKDPQFEFCNGQISLKQWVD